MKHNLFSSAVVRALPRYYWPYNISFSFFGIHFFAQFRLKFWEPFVPLFNCLRYVPMYCTRY